jgi:D-psicose/D-tagatose/L-ribulose 3-epimerase
MKLAVSNIAWPITQDEQVADLLLHFGITGVEIAPTKIWPNPLEATDSQILDYRRFWESRGLSIVAAQALLFGRPELTLFESAEVRKQTLDYLKGIIRVCALAGAKALVFGSPKNRKRGTRTEEDVWPEAVEFFAELGEAAQHAGTTLVLEANPADYGADFITRGSEALQLVQAVNHPGFLLHLDTACMHLAGDDPSSLIPSCVTVLKHFHASEPHLAPLGQGGIDHSATRTLLEKANYQGWVSLEMRQPEPFEFEGSLQFFQQVWRQG